MQLPSEIPLMETQQEEKPVDFIYNNIQSKAPKTNRDKAIEEVGFQSKTDALVNYNNSPEKLSFQNEGFEVGDAYTKLTNGDYITRYDDFLQGTDNENRHAQQQSTTEKWTNGLGKFIGKTANNVVGGTLGTAYGAISAITEGNWERIYDNEFYDFLDDQNTKMDNLVANYRSQEERDLGFFSSLGTANFWADDFLGGLSFMAGTVISESLWAAATGGASLTTTAARTGLRASKYFNGAKTLINGSKKSYSSVKKYLRADETLKALETASTFGKAGKVAQLARFTYTGAGFEAGMEARLYQKEQRENFNKDFESLNGRKATPEEISEFENNLDTTTKSLWATNMALVGTSNFAILGKTFGISSPFKSSSKFLDKKLFGKGTIETFKDGVRTGSKAIKRTKFQKTLGVSKAILKNPFYEGFVEEGGQAASSSSMEEYVTSRYNPNKETADLLESMYEGFSHAYGTKEGWKEVGLGALIGLLGGEANNVLSGQGFLTEAKNALKDSDGKLIKNDEGKVVGGTGSLGEAFNKNENLGTNLLNRVMATSVNEKIHLATEIQNATEELEQAEQEGKVSKIANAQTKILLASAKNAVDFDYLDEQIKDFKLSLDLRSPEELQSQFGIEASEVESRKKELVGQYKRLAERYETAKNYSNYLVSDNFKETDEQDNDINPEVVKTAIAYQMVMAQEMEENMTNVHDAINESLNEFKGEIPAEQVKAWANSRSLYKQSKQERQNQIKIETRLNKANQDLQSFYNSLEKLDNIKSNEEGANKKIADRRDKLQTRIEKKEQDILGIKKNLSEISSKLSSSQELSGNLSQAGKNLQNQLDQIDPFSGAELVEESSILDIQKNLEELNKTLKNLRATKPELVSKIDRLSEEHQDALSIWKRNADTIQQITDPELGMKRVGTMFQKKKKGGTTTLDFFKKLQQTQAEELQFSSEIEALVTTPEIDTTVAEEENNQKKADESQGADITQESSQEVLDKQVKNIEKRRQEELDALSNTPSIFNNLEEKIKKILNIKQSDKETITSENIDKIRKKPLPKDTFDNLFKEIGEKLNKVKTSKKEIRDLIKKIHPDKYTDDSRKKVAEAYLSIINDFLEKNDISVEQIEAIEESFNEDITTLYDTNTVENESTKINTKYDAELATLKRQKNTSQKESKPDELKTLLGELVGRNRDLLDNFTEDPQKLQEENAPTQEDLDKYKELREKARGDINKLVGRPFEKLGKRTKERSNLSDTEIQEYRELNTRFANWRLITGTNKDGTSIQDILNQIEKFEQEANEEFTGMTAEQQFEIAEEASYEEGAKDSDFIQTMTYVNIGKSKTHMNISHLSLNMLDETGVPYTVLETEKNIGTKKEPNFVTVYEMGEGDSAIRVLRTEDTRHRFMVERGEDFTKFKNLLGIEVKNYKQEHSWSFAFKDGVLYESDYNLSKAEGEKLHAEEIYNLKPGDKVKFSISANDSYNIKDIIPLIEEGKLEEAKANMVVYIRTTDGKTVGLLKAGKEKKIKNSNFNKLREEAFNQLQSQVESGEFTLEDLVSDNNIIDLGLETEVQKVFTGTPNLTLNEDGTLKTFRISKEQYDNHIDSFGYSTKGKLDKEIEGVRMTFIPKDKSTPYVIIKQGETKIAYPVGLKGRDSSVVKEEIQDIVNSEIPQNEKVLQIISKLQSLGIDPRQVEELSVVGNLDTAIQQIDSLLNRPDTKILFSAKSIESLSKEEFLEKAEILLDLEKTPFVSPKLKIKLSSELNNIETGETSKSDKISKEQRDEMIQNYLTELSKAQREQEVKDYVENTGDETFISEFRENKVYRKEVIKASMANNSVPIIETDKSMEEILLDQIDVDSDGLPLDIPEEFRDEIESIKEDPQPSKIKSLAKKIKTSLKNRFTIISSAIDNSNLYFISTTESREEMFEKGFVRFKGDFYKKVDKTLSKEDILKGLYNKESLPSHMSEQYESFEEFEDSMPLNLLDIYERYYNTQEEAPKSKKEIFEGENSNYLREDFEGDFSDFIIENKKNNTTLYNEVLKHFEVTAKGILKKDTLSKEKLDKYKDEFPEIYSNLLEYSLINRHIDLQNTPQNVIFTEDIYQAERLEAINSPNLKKPKGKVEIAMDGTLTLSKSNPTFIKMGDSVYEKSFINVQGEQVYEKIATVDPKFYTTEVETSLNNHIPEPSKELNEKKPKINTTEGTKLDCDQ